VHQRIVVGPAANTVDPAFEELELGLAEVADDSLQHGHGEDFLFEDLAAEELVGNLHQEVLTILGKNGAAETD